MNKLTKYFSTLAIVALSLAALPPLAQAQPPCPNGPDYKYVSRDAEECLTLQFICAEGVQFFNECGCGCTTATTLAATVPADLEGFEALLPVLEPVAECETEEAAE